jgi:hypothetical protein
MAGTEVVLANRTRAVEESGEASALAMGENRKDMQSDKPGHGAKELDQPLSVDPATTPVLVENTPPSGGGNAGAESIPSYLNRSGDLPDAQQMDDALKAKLTNLPDGDTGLDYASGTIEQFHSALAQFSEKAKWSLAGLVAILVGAGSIGWLAFSEERNLVQSLLLVTAAVFVCLVTRSACLASSRMLKNFYDIYSSSVIWAALVHRHLGLEMHPWCELVWRNIDKLPNEFWTAWRALSGENPPDGGTSAPKDGSRIHWCGEAEPDPWFGTDPEMPDRPVIYLKDSEGRTKSALMLVVDAWRTTPGTTLSRYLTSIRLVKLLAEVGGGLLVLLTVAMMAWNWSNERKWSASWPKSKEDPELTVRLGVHSNQWAHLLGWVPTNTVTITNVVVVTNYVDAPRPGSSQP